jgi:hypothetical protein
MKKKFPVILFLILLAIAVAIGIYRRISTQTKFNGTYVNGNTAGNLYNSGLFCENGGTIFFSNPDDDGKLYCMDSNGANLKKLNDDTPTYINADANYVYYTRNNPSDDTSFSFLNINTHSLCRMNRNGKGSVLILDTETSIYASLVGDYIYYIRYTKDSASTLYRIRIDGEEMEQVNEIPYYTCSTNGQYIYYNGREDDHNIRRLNTATGSENIIYRVNCWMPTVINGTTAYFLDCENNYSLARVELSNGEQVTLTNDRIDTYNVYNDYIYFQRSGSDPALCRIRTDGTEYLEIAPGTYNTINVTADFVYFTEYDSGDMLRTPTKSPGVIEDFHPGKKN